MVVDDCFFHGDVANSTPVNEKGEGIKAFMGCATTQESWFRIALPIANVIYLMVHK